MPSVSSRRSRPGPVFRPAFSDGLKRTGTLFLICISLWFASARGRAADQIPGYVVLPLVQIGPHAAGVRATIDGHAVSLIVDTGAPYTALDRRFYKGIITSSSTAAPSALPAGLPKTALLNGVHADVGQIQNMQAGPMRFGNGPVMVTDLSVLADDNRDYNHQHPDAPIGGLLGDDILNSYAAIIDWRRRGIYFNTDPSKRLKLGKGLTAAGWTAVPMARSNGRHFVVPTTIENRSFQIIVDTGASFTSLDRNVLHSRNVIYGKGVMPMQMIGSASLGLPIRLDNWVIGNYHVPPVSVLTVLIPQGILRESSSIQNPMLGLLGREVLARNSAIIDISGSTLYLKPASGR